MGVLAFNFKELSADGNEDAAYWFVLLAFELDPIGALSTYSALDL